MALPTSLGPAEPPRPSGSPRPASSISPPLCPLCGEGCAVPCLRCPCGHTTNTPRPAPIAVPPAPSLGKAWASTSSSDGSGLGGQQDAPGVPKAAEGSAHGLGSWTAARVGPSRRILLCGFQQKQRKAALVADILALGGEVVTDTAQDWTHLVAEKLTRCEKVRPRLSWG
eukprot:RCo007750